MSLMIDNRQDKFDVDKIEKLIERVVNQVVEREKMKRDWQVSIILVDNEQIKEMNNLYRKIDNPTDVLSFPMLDYEDGVIPWQQSDNVVKDAEDIDMDTGEMVLGDIVISLQKAYEQSLEYDHSFERETAFLTVHGMLHLLGYDHEEDNDRMMMRKKEDEILDSLSIQR